MAAVRHVGMLVLDGQLVLAGVVVNIGSERMYWSRVVRNSSLLIG